MNHTTSFKERRHWFCNNNNEMECMIFGYFVYFWCILLWISNGVKRTCPKWCQSEPKVDYLTKQTLEPFPKVEPPFFLFRFVDVMSKSKQSKRGKKYKCMVMGQPSSPQLFLMEKESKTKKAKKKEKWDNFS